MVSILAKKKRVKKGVGEGREQLGINGEEMEENLWSKLLKILTE